MVRMNKWPIYTNKSTEILNEISNDSDWNIIWGKH